MTPPYATDDPPDDTTPNAVTHDTTAATNPTTATNVAPPADVAPELHEDDA